MAASKAKGAAQGTPDEDDFSAPSNFEDVGTPDIDGWFKPEEGSKFMGQVVGRITIPNDDGKMRDVVLVKLTKPCKGCVTVEGEDGQSLEPGKVLGVGIRAKLTELLYYVEKKGNVYAQALSKQKLKGGRTMWVFDVKGEKGKRANPPAPVVHSTSGDGDNDVGF